MKPCELTGLVVAGITHTLAVHALASKEKHIIFMKQGGRPRRMPRRGWRAETVAERALERLGGQAGQAVVFCGILRSLPSRVLAGNVRPIFVVYK